MRFSQQRNNLITTLCIAALALILAIPALAWYERDVVNPILDRADSHIQRGEWDAAIAESTLAIQRDPFRSVAYVYRGFALQGSGDPDAANHDYDRAWMLNMRSAEMFNAKGVLMYHGGYLEAAITHYDIAIHLDPNQAEFYYNRARALDDYGYPVSAAEDYQHFLTHYAQTDDYSRYAQDRLAALGN